jgi:hypothetical protein
MRTHHRTNRFPRCSHEYLNERKTSQNIPSVWTPRLKRVEQYDRSLKFAILRYYDTYENFWKVMGLIPHHEWMYLERQHDLMISLKDYCNEHLGGDLSTFPSGVRVKKEDGRLFQLITDYGGRKFVAARLGMTHDYMDKRERFDLNWGPFELEFGISLLSFIREDQMQQEPPLRHPAIFIPTQAKLLSTPDGSVGEYLNKKILEYGGYENVARYVSRKD